MVAEIRVVKGNLNKLKRTAAKFAKDVRPEIAAAINQTSKQLRTAASKDIRAKLAAKKKDVDQKLNRKIANARDLLGKLYISEKSLGLGKFKTSQVKTGVRAKIQKQGSLTVYPSAFGPKTKLNPYVYKRAGKASYPIKTAAVVSFQDFVEDHGLEAVIRQRVKPLLKNNVARRMKLMMLRAKGLVPESAYSRSG